MEIRPLAMERYDEAQAFAHEHLGESGGGLFGECIQANPELALVYEDGEGRMIGLCFGIARRAAPDEVVLQGIAIRRDVAVKGLGSKLLDQFEQVVANHGYTKISVGSADGYVERFYLKNGYVATEHLACLPHRDDEKMAGLDVTRVREEDGRVMVNIKATGAYGPTDKKALQEKLGASSVSLIFEKELDTTARAGG